MASTKTSSNAATGSDSKMNCVVATGTRIEGDFKTTEHVRIDGILKGTIECDKKLVLGKSARLEGKLKARDAVIMGSVEGDLQIAGLLKLESTAAIKGDIRAQKIIVEEGARYDGISKIG